MSMPVDLVAELKMLQLRIYEATGQVVKMSIALPERLHAEVVGERVRMASPRPLPPDLPPMRVGIHDGIEFVLATPPL